MQLVCLTPLPLASSCTHSPLEFVLRAQIRRFGTLTFFLSLFLSYTMPQFFPVQFTRFTKHPRIFSLPPSLFWQVGGVYRSRWCRRKTCNFNSQKNPASRRETRQAPPLWTGVLVLYNRRLCRSGSRTCSTNKDLCRCALLDSGIWFAASHQKRTYFQRYSPNVECNRLYWLSVAVWIY